MSSHNQNETNEHQTTIVAPPVVPAVPPSDTFTFATTGNQTV